MNQLELPGFIMNHDDPSWSSTWIGPGLGLGPELFQDQDLVQEQDHDII